jgi:hypothetical protein
LTEPSRTAYFSGFRRRLVRSGQLRTTLSSEVALGGRLIDFVPPEAAAFRALRQSEVPGVRPVRHPDGTTAAAEDDDPFARCWVSAKHAQSLIETIRPESRIEPLRAGG